MSEATGADSQDLFRQYIIGQQHGVTCDSVYLSAFVSQGLLYIVRFWHLGVQRSYAVS